MFLGEYHHNLDDKSRIVIPNKYRESLNNEFVVAKGLEKCLYIYPNNEWEQLVSKLSTLPFTKKDARTFIRTFFSGSTVCEIDKQGRITLPDYLLKYANIKKSAVIIGANERIEIWDELDFEKMMQENSEKIENIAESLFSEN